MYRIKIAYDMRLFFCNMDFIHLFIHPCYISTVIFKLKHLLTPESFKEKSTLAGCSFILYQLLLYKKQRAYSVFFRMGRGSGWKKYIKL